MKKIEETTELTKDHYDMLKDQLSQRRVKLIAQNTLLDQAKQQLTESTERLKKRKNA